MGKRENNIDEGKAKRLIFVKSSKHWQKKQLISISITYV